MHSRPYQCHRFYCTCIRSILEYSCEVFHFSLPKYLSDNIECFQKRILSIILPGKSYSDRLSITSLNSLHDRRYQLTKKTFNSIVANRNHKLHDLLPDVNVSSYFLRNPRDFNIPKCISLNNHFYLLVHQIFSMIYFNI